MTTKDFISLRASLDRAEFEHAQFRTALEAYLEALAGVERHVFQPCAGKIRSNPPTVEKARQRLAEDPGQEQWAEARRELDQALRTAHDFISRELAGTVELAEVVKLLEDTAASLIQRGSRKETEFLDVATGLRRAAEREDLAELRQQILCQVQLITTLVEQMRQENRQLVAELEQEMQAYRRRLDEVERSARRDALTGLSNRASFEQRARELIQSGVPFSLVLADLNHFKRVNDVHGHLAGDELLRTFASRLKHQLRADDMAARWGGDEFVILLPVPLRDAMARARLLEQALSGDYQLTVGGETLRVRVGLSMGVAEYRPGESLEDLLGRADQALYQIKARR
ncbi:MAG: GGDEF domain-containing protein [Bryobacteraceae bacterium]